MEGADSCRYAPLWCMLLMMISEKVIAKKQMGSDFTEHDVFNVIYTPLLLSAAS